MAKPLFLLLVLLFLTSSLLVLVSAAHSQHLSKGSSYYGRRRRMLLDVQDDDEDNKPVVKKKSSSSSSSTKNSTKLIKPSSGSSKNQTKLTKTTNSTTSTGTKLIKLPSDNSSKNKTKITKSNTTSTSSSADTKLKPQIKKLNSTSKSSSSNSTSKSTSLLTKKSSSSDLTKQNKTTKATPSKETKVQLKKTVGESKQPKKPQKKPSWIDDDEDEEDLVSEFRGLPSKFQETFMPDLEKISKTSRSYLTQYNKEFTKGFKPYVGNKYASTIASFVSFAFIIIPLILVSLIFNRIKAYFSLLKLLIFIQIYLAIYFTILCLSSLITGLEPMKFFYATSQSTYVCVQVLQTLAYVFYLLLLLMYLVLVFSTESGVASKVLGLGQTFVGFAVGLHYYMTVFHRAVLRQPPKTSWKVQAVYATCFLAVCLLGRLDRSKKAYLEDGGEEGKKS